MSGLKSSGFVIGALISINADALFFSRMYFVARAPPKECPTKMGFVMLFSFRNSSSISMCSFFSNGAFP